MFVSCSLSVFTSSVSNAFDMVG